MFETHLMDKVWTVTRKYKEFTELRDGLVGWHPESYVPPIP